MVLRTARCGRNAGNQFWGCSRYPDCTGIRSLEEPSTNPNTNSSALPYTQPQQQPNNLPVVWADSVRRNNWIAEYTSVGALAGFATESLGQTNARLSQVSSQSLVLSSRSRSRDADEDSRLVGALLSKVLQRGRAPFPTLGVEESALKVNGLADWIIELPSSRPDIGFDLARNFQGRVTPEMVVQAFSGRKPFKLDPEFNLDFRANRYCCGT